MITLYLIFAGRRTIAAGGRGREACEHWTQAVLGEVAYIISRFPLHKSLDNISSMRGGTGAGEG